MNVQNSQDQEGQVHSKLPPPFFSSQSLRSPDLQAQAGASRRSASSRFQTHRSSFDQYARQRGPYSPPISRSQYEQQRVEGRYRGQTSQLGAKDNVKVAIRVRPLHENEHNAGLQNTLQISQDNKQIEVNQPGQNQSQIRQFEFHACMGPECGQADVMYLCSIQQLLDAALLGYHVTIMAYGQTGSGKTYTITGQEEASSSSQGGLHSSFVPGPADGIVARSVQYLFNAIAQEPQSQYSMRVTCSEIYNEAIYDLLNLNNKQLVVKWDPQAGFYVPALKVMNCTGIDDVMSAITKGISARRVGSHELNLESSRSHSLFTIYCDHVQTDPSSHDYGAQKYGKITFVDLAGSERLKISKSTCVRETSSINKSLFTLGKVISALSEVENSGGVPGHVPYRDSKLTKLLMDSLGGSSLALMIACCSPNPQSIDETIQTLSYAQRVKSIRNRPIVQYDPQQGIIYALRQEIELLKAENMHLRESMGLTGLNTYNFDNQRSSKQSQNFVSSRAQSTTEDTKVNFNEQINATQSQQPIDKGEFSDIQNYLQQSLDKIDQSLHIAISNRPTEQALIGQAYDSIDVFNQSNHIEQSSNQASQSLEIDYLDTIGKVNSTDNEQTVNLAKVELANPASSSNVQEAKVNNAPTNVNVQISEKQQNADISAHSQWAANAHSSQLAINPLVQGSQPPSIEKQLGQAQQLLGQYSDQNSKLAWENDRLRTGKALMAEDYKRVLEEIDTLRQKMTQLETAVWQDNSTKQGYQSVPQSPSIDIQTIEHDTQIADQETLTARHVSHQASGGHRSPSVLQSPLSSKDDGGRARIKLSSKPAGVRSMVAGVGGSSVYSSDDRSPQSDIGAIRGSGRRRNKQVAESESDGSVMKVDVKRLHLLFGEKAGGL